MRCKPTLKKMLALVFLVCFIAAYSLPFVFILTHLDHSHDHNGIDESCATCAQIQYAENILKQLSTASISTLFALLGAFTSIAIIKAAIAFNLTTTLITLKIRMNN